MPKTKRPNGRTKEQMSADMKAHHRRKRKTKLITNLEASKARRAGEASRRSEGQKRRYAAMRAARGEAVTTALTPPVTYTGAELAMAMHCQAWLNTGPRELVRMVLDQINRQ